jgi:integrase/recombinase XerD
MSVKHVDPACRRMPVAEWPALDRALWARALQDPDPFDETVGYARRWKPSTAQTYASGYGRWLTWLEGCGELELHCPPAARITRDRAKRFSEHLKRQGLADYTCSGVIQDLGRVAQSMDPAADLAWIIRGAGRMHAAAIPTKDLEPILDQSVAQVEQLGLDMMAAADGDRFRTPSERAVLYRDGLLIAFLVNRPLRLANLTSLTIGVQLRRSDIGWRFAFGEDEMKGGRSFAGSWPGNLIPHLEHYIKVHRGVLSGSEAVETETGGLWIALGGKPMGSHAIAHQIKRRTLDELGVAINPHAFRHLTATAIATVMPEDVVTSTAVLAHSSIAVTETYYNKAKMADAADRYHVVLEAERNSRPSHQDVPQRSSLVD